MLREDTVIQLPDGRFEQKIQVDRRKLESMITGRIDNTSHQLPTAESFFANVMSYSNAEVIWPSQLKIGAKTKKDPYVKVIGSIEQIESARTLVLNSLQIKKERVSLKMELHHSLHSHIIGKGGRGIQKVMKMTSCHIHFPDSNKYSDSNKSDQVSISGTPVNVFEALKHLRSMCPLTVYMKLPWYNPGQPDLRPLMSQMDLDVSVEQNIYSLAIKMTGSQDASVLFAIRLVLHHFLLTEEYLNISTQVLAREELNYQLENVEEHRERLREVCNKNNVTIQTFPETQSISIVGPPSGVLNVRKLLIGLSSVTVQFDCNMMDIHYPVQQLEQERGIQVTCKRKNGDIMTITMKSTESKLAEVLQSRELLLALPPTTYSSPDDYDPNPVMSRPPSLTPLQTEMASGVRVFLTPPIESPKSPDPEDSPLAASILKGAKDISKNSDIWKKKSKADRGEMLIKATQAIFDDSVLSSPRYPTDLWSGYGFSSSLPADLLKGMMDLSTNEPSTNGPPMMNHSQRGLCSVREEDEELSDFSASSTNYGMSRIFEQPPRNVFSASTSVFDSNSLPYNLQWDINYFTDPSMVLAQLGCSEYMTQLRDQEIDMHAFLLLDEQNLKDIGVSTIGARKKIHHAILKLRDSARLNGYAV
ncbi:SAM domain-containing protein [Caenorhabditis elegans]|uniref:SAM domain-containing protein n=1 Tax=Caenorhabditis elegans TaxID=6239 RepID=Q21593_CAEEL|nr:SAM domain-containing protein [Caenorhabditis elegans]CAA92750.3 SAM domain-containing protein [Caenorhabditis elegans]|eukprot:NP_502067.2 BiCaudal C (Drosophila) homolog [Caenorhabditis elegans]